MTLSKTLNILQSRYNLSNYFTAMISKTTFSFLLLSFCFLYTTQAQPIAINKETKEAFIKPKIKQESLSFVKNKAQWHSNVLYKVPLAGGNSLYLENNTFTYVLQHPEDAEKLHNHDHGNHEGHDHADHEGHDHADHEGHDHHEHETEDQIVRMHAYKVNFIGANNPQLRAYKPKQEYYNFFLGNDQSKWAGNVPAYEKVNYQSIYDGIDLHAYSKEGQFKYDFVVAPNINADKIQLAYKGTEGLEIDNGNLLIHTSVQTVTEFRPYAYQIINGKEHAVACDYVITGEVVSFEFPNGYDTSKKLVIDPVVVAATLSGGNVNSNNGTFGNTATFDSEGNIYAGGHAFGSGYPTTTGAFQTNFGGGERDMVISKYNPDGSNLIYATYLGGSNDDIPHSIITDFSQQVYIYGSSESTNYPTSSNAFQNSKSGSADIVVTVLNSTGSGIVGSTFMGGSGVDGLNRDISASRVWNYDDRLRGEIIIDGQNNVYIASYTRSNNFPTTTNAFDQTFNSTSGTPISTVPAPAQDGVIFKLNSDLSTLYWSTFIGEDGTDAVFGLRLDDFTNVYAIGYAGGANFPTTSNTVQPNWPGGNENAFVLHLAADGSSLLSSTFWGSSNGHEHGFFLDIDESGNIHTYGQTTGTMPITNGVYAQNPGSSQYLTAFSPNLDDVIYSTVIGSGSTPTIGNQDFDFTPVAFMVDKCDFIYFSGYQFSDSYQLNTTVDAVSNSPGSFYLGVLDPNATGLSYGTFYGDANHVDGGTSRFDKGGIVYQGVCSCTTNNILNTTSNAWAQNQLNRCDLGVFKIDFERNTVTAAATATPSTSGCAPFTVDFQYTGQDATVFEWDFGDNTGISTFENPTHTFTEAGTYIVAMQASNPLACNEVDIVYITIDVLDGNTSWQDTVICSGGTEQIFLDVSTQNATYLWQDGSINAVYVVTDPGLYFVETSVPGCTRLDSFQVDEAQFFDIDLGPDIQTVCDQATFPIDAQTQYIDNFVWNDGSTGPVLTVSSNGEYSVTGIDTSGCIVQDTINILFGTTPTIALGPDEILCPGQERVLDATSSSAIYQWQDASTNPTFTVTQAGTYWVTANDNGCIGRDSVTIDYTPDIGLTIEPTNISCFSECDGAAVALNSLGATNLSYTWDIGDVDSDIEDLCPGDYTLVVVDEYDCIYEQVVTILEPGILDPNPIVSDVPCPGENSGSIDVQPIGGTGPFSYSFQGEEYTANNLLNNLDGGTYSVAIIDANGCEARAQVSVYEPPEIFINAGPDHQIELGDSVRLQGQIVPTIINQLFSWTPKFRLRDSTTLRPFVRPYQTTTYTLTVVDSITGCEQVDEATVFVDKVREVYIPNAFSPNEDGNNDSFTIFAGPGIVEIQEFRVFDRWGELVHEKYSIQPNDLREGWNGVFKGQKMQPAVFAYMAYIEFDDGLVKLYKGDVTLLR